MSWMYGFAKVWQKTCFFDVGKEMVIFFDYSHLMKKNVYMVILTWKILYFQHLYKMWFSVFFFLKNVKSIWSRVRKSLSISMWNMGKLMRIKINMGILYWKKNLVFFREKSIFFKVSSINGNYKKYVKFCVCSKWHYQWGIWYGFYFVECTFTNL